MFIDVDEAIIGLSAESVFINLGGFVSIAGSFSFEQGGLDNVEVVRTGTGAGTSTVEVTTTKIGVGGAARSGCSGGVRSQRRWVGLRHRLR